MVQAPEFLTHLVRTALGRSVPDNGEHSLEQEPTLATGALTPRSSPRPRDGDGFGFDPGIVSVLSEKVLLAWLRNRYQLLFPFALDLRRLDPLKATLLVEAMVAAAQADGSLDGKERRRIEGTLSLVDAHADETAFLDRAISQARSLHAILSDVRDVETGAMVYAASLMAVDQRKPVNRLYLRYLAARLQLSDELVESLEQRYQASG